MANVFQACSRADATRKRAAPSPEEGRLRKVLKHERYQYYLAVRRDMTGTKRLAVAADDSVVGKSHHELGVWQRLLGAILEEA